MFIQTANRFKYINIVSIFRRTEKYQILISFTATMYFLHWTILFTDWMICVYMYMYMKNTVISFFFLSFFSIGLLFT